MGLLSNKRWLGGAVAVVGAWLVLGACTGTPVGVVDDDAGNPEGGGGEATSEAGNDATVDGGSEGSTGNDGSSDGTTTMPEASMDANDGGTTESGVVDASEAGSEAGTDAAGDAPIDSPPDVAPEAASDAESDAESDSASDAPVDSPLEAAPCTFAGTWSMTVQTVTAVPTLCQGIMDCTNCGVLFNATATQPTPSTIDWSVDPGGVLCTAFSGNITAAGQFTTNSTNCSPYSATYNGQIDLSTCSLTATYVYTVGTCTVTETMTGAE